MDKVIGGLMLALFAIIVLYFMAVQMQAISNPTVSEDIAFAVPDEVAFTYSPVYSVSSFANATDSCGSGNYSYTTTAINLTEGEYCEDGTYTITYTYQENATVWGIDFNFIALLLFLAVGFGIVVGLTRRK